MIRKHFLIAFLLFVLAPLHVSNNKEGAVFASGQLAEGQIISDDEIETTIEGWLGEIFAVAGIKSKPKVLLVASSEINAAATFNNTIFIHTELLVACKNVTELFAVLAHETGHIAGCHIAKYGDGFKQSLGTSAAIILLSGIASIVSGSGEPLAAGLLGGVGVWERGFLKYSRDQENIADSSAMGYLQKLGFPLSGFVSFLDTMEENRSTADLNPYTSTHPLSSNRKSSVLLREEQRPYKLCNLKPYEDKFKMIRAKVIGFIYPDRISTFFSDEDKSISAGYARCIAKYRGGELNESIKMLNVLIQENPKNPFFMELKGQMLFEFGQIDGAVESLRKSLILLPSSKNTGVLLAHALLESTPDNNGNQNTSPNNAKTMEALSLLEKASASNPQNVMAWRLLAIAHGRLGHHDHVALALANEDLLFGRLSNAKKNAEKAAKSNNNSIRSRARDILHQIKNSH